MRINELLIRLLPGLFAYQVFMVAAPTPTVEALLDSSMRESTKRADALAGTAAGERAR